MIWMAWMVMSRGPVESRGPPREILRMRRRLKSAATRSEGMAWPVEAAGVGGVADDAVGGDGDFLSGGVCGKLEGEDAVVEFGVAEVEPELSLLVGGVDGEADAEAEG